MYIEVFIIYNFMVHIALNYLAVHIYKGRISALRVIASAFIATLILSFYPFIGYKYPLIIVSLLISGIFTVKYSHFFEYCNFIFLVLLLRFLLGGLALFLCYVLPFGLGNYYYIVLLSALLIFSAFVTIVNKNTLSARKNNGKLYYVKIFSGESEQKTMAFYDTGNKLYTKNGETVVMLDKQLYNKLGLSNEEKIKVRTVAGDTELTVGEATILIYFEDGENRIYSTKVSAVELTNENYKMILHSDMLEVV